MYVFVIEIINNKARHNLIVAKYQQMAFRSVPTTLLFGIWSNKSDANLEDSDCTVQMLLFISIVRSVECRNLCRTGFLAGSSRYKKFSALPDFHNIFPPFLQTIDYSSPRGGISVETNTSGNIPTSYLLIDSVAPSDSGKYTCRPANAGEISVNVHIQDGK